MPIDETKQASFARIKNYLEQDPDNVRLLGEAAELCLQLGDFTQGKTYAQHALSIAPDAAVILNTLGLLELVSGNAIEACDIFQALVNGGVTSPAVRSNLAYTLLLKGEPQSIPELLSDAVECSAEAPDAPSLMIRALHTLGEVDQAIAFAKNYLEHNPKDATACALLSTLYIDNEDFEAAGHLAEQAKQLGGVIPEAWVTSGTLELAQQNDTSALEHFDLALKANPSSGRAIAGRGLAHMLGRDMTKAIDDLKQAAHKMPNHIGTWHALGWAQLFQNDLAGARQTFEHALSLNPNFAESHGALAVVMVAEGKQVTEAQQAVKRALGLDKQCFSGLFAKSLLLNAQGRPELARKIIEGIMNSGVLPGGVTLQQSLVTYLKQQKKPN